MLIAAIGFLFLVVIFAVQNAQMVDIRFMFWTLTINQALVVLGSASIGVIIGSIWTWIRDLPVRSKVKELTKELEAEREKLIQTQNSLRSSKQEFDNKQTNEVQATIQQK